MNSTKSGPNSIESFLSDLISQFTARYLSAGFLVIKHLVKHDAFILKRVSKTKRTLIFIGVAFVILALNTLTIFFLKSKVVSAALILISFPTIHAFICFILAEELYKKEISYKLTKTQLKNKIQDTNILESELNEISRTPAGISFATNKPVFFETKNRTRHIAISGATGQGKSSFAISLRRHDLKWGRPIIDIDPKGSSEDIEIIKGFCRHYGRESDFIHFNIVDQSNSFSYNPLAIGSVDERIEKITTVLELENEFYRGFAMNLFSIIFQCFDALNEVPTISKLCDLLLDKNRIQLFFKSILEKPTDQFQELKKQIRGFMDFDKEKILGIQAKISRLNSPTFGKILNPSEKINLDLIDVVKNNKYVYFQLNIAQYKEVSTYLINFILYDLKLICGLIDSKRLELKSDFLPVYIDEYASFGNEDFPEFLRVARSGKIGITVMFQSYASLDLITPVLKDEITTNTAYSVHFNPGGSVADIDFISKMPGTLYINQRSHQILEGGSTPDEAARGTQFRAEEMRIDANLYRELKMGQAVIYNKEHNEIDLIESWHGKKSYSLMKTNKDKSIKIEDTLGLIQENKEPETIEIVP